MTRPPNLTAGCPAVTCGGGELRAVVSDTDLLHHAQEIIDEFPFFSFLLGDLHPHVLAIPFNLLAVALALNMFLGGWRGETHLFGLRLHISRTGFLAAALTLGGLAFLNTWDILIAAALVVLAYVLLRVREDRWSWARLEDVFSLGVPLGVSGRFSLFAFLYWLFIPGRRHSAKPDQPDARRPIWVMFAPMFVILLAYLIYLWRAERRPAKWLLSLLVVTGLIVLLWVFSWTMAWLVFLKDPGFAQQYLASQGMADLGSFLTLAMSRRFSYIGGLLTLVVLLLPALAFIIAKRRTPAEGEAQPSAFHPQPETFIFLLILLGTLLVIAPEFMYLRDQFNYRINTVFKFYYQAWLLWSLAAAFGAAILLQNLHGARDWTFRVGLSVLLLMALTYPALSIVTKTNNFNPPGGWTLDDFARIRRENPDEAAGITWLKSAPEGVVAEAVGPNGGSYTGYARISVYSGLPAVLGWAGHETQWRGTNVRPGNARG